MFPFKHSTHSFRPGKLWCESFLYFVQNLSVRYSSECEVKSATFFDIKYVSMCLYGLGGFMPCSMNLALIFLASNACPFCVRTMSALFKSLHNGRRMGRSLPRF